LEVAGNWRRLHNEALHNLYASQNVIRAIESRWMKWVGWGGVGWGGMGEMRNACNILVGKSEGKRPVGRPRRKWEVNMRMDLREAGWEVVNWINLVQDRYQWQNLAYTAMNLQAP
jgi:hypothetical protein